MVALDGLAQRDAAPERSMWLLAALTVAWGVVMRQFGAGNIYSIVGSYALGVNAILLVLYRRLLAEWLRARARDVLIGACVGAAMTALTYPLYHFAVGLVPGLSPVVAGLYRTSSGESLGAAVLWVVLIITAEELLFRGAWLHALEAQLTRRAALGLSVVLYAAAQAFSGSLIVGLLALCCGSIWTLERALTGSLVAPLVSHLIWTPVVILLHPVSA